MIYENELKPWEVTNLSIANDNYVKFAFERNELESRPTDIETLPEVISI
jgi:hypothetical protein